MATQLLRSNKQFLRDLEAAFKGITNVDELGQSILQPEKMDRFVREARDATVVLPETRFIPMDTQQVDIDRVGFAGRILVPGDQAATDDVIIDKANFAEPATATNSLIAKELQAVTGLKDRALRRNIERGNFENTLVDLFGEAAGRDLEEYAMLGDVASADAFLALTDGWVKRAAQKVYGVESSGGAADQDFDPTDVESMFQAMLDSLPKRFMRDMSRWRFYVPWADQDSYRDVLRARGTDLGDRTQTGDITTDLVFKGIPVRYAPVLERAAERLALLAHPDNLTWGVFHEVTIEPEREAKGRRTDFVLTVEADADYEDENGAVAAYPERAKVL